MKHSRQMLYFVRTDTYFMQIIANNNTSWSSGTDTDTDASISTSLI